MVGFLKLELTEVDHFCNNVNTFKSSVYAIEDDRTVYIKSLISLLTLDLSKPIKIIIDSEDKYELDAFEDLIFRYGGTIDDKS